MGHWRRKNLTRRRLQPACARLGVVGVLCSMVGCTNVCMCGSIRSGRRRGMGTRVDGGMGFNENQGQPESRAVFRCAGRTMMSLDAACEPLANHWRSTWASGGAESLTAPSSDTVIGGPQKVVAFFSAWRTDTRSSSSSWSREVHRSRQRTWEVDKRSVASSHRPSR